MIQLKNKLINQLPRINNNKLTIRKTDLKPPIQPHTSSAEKETKKPRSDTHRPNHPEIQPKAINQIRSKLDLTKRMGGPQEDERNGC